jgi:hypothetical protein
MAAGSTAKGQCPVRVKLRRTQSEHMFSALPSNSDIARRIRHVSKVPEADLSELPQPSSSLVRGEPSASEKNRKDRVKRDRRRGVRLYCIVAPAARQHFAKFAKTKIRIPYRAIMRMGRRELALGRSAEKMLEHRREQPKQPKALELRP